MSLSDSLNHLAHPAHAKLRADFVAAETSVGEIAMRVITLPPGSGFRKNNYKDAKSQLLLNMNFVKS